MFNTNEFYDYTQRGISVDIVELQNYISSFETVILWGAGNLGKALLEKLRQNNVRVDIIWDKRADEIANSLSIKCEVPFAGDYDRLKTLIITAIVNGSLGEKRYASEAAGNGYEHTLLGMSLYQALLCPFEADGEIDASICRDSSACSLTMCKRYLHLINKSKNYADSLCWPIIAFQITTRCVQSCLNCGERIPEYRALGICEDDSFELVKTEIDAVSEALDALGVAIISGGEPLLHRDLVDIAEYMQTKNNIGMVMLLLSSPSMYLLKDETIEKLAQLDSRRFVISISHYEDALQEEDKQIFYNCMNKLEKNDVPFYVNVPVWVKRIEPFNYNHSEEALTTAKQNCEASKLCVSAIKGKLTACPLIRKRLFIDGLDIEPDYLDLTSKTGNSQQRFLDYFNRPFYDSCKYCPFHLPSEEVIPGV